MSNYYIKVIINESMTVQDVCDFLKEIGHSVGYVVDSFSGNATYIELQLGDKRQSITYYDETTTLQKTGIEGVMLYMDVSSDSNALFLKLLQHFGGYHTISDCEENEIFVFVGGEMATYTTYDKLINDIKIKGLSKYKDEVLEIFTKYSNKTIEQLKNEK